MEWFSRHPSAVLRLFCFSCAGGSAAAFRPWAKLLPNRVELCGIELPGRGLRHGESLITDFRMLMDSLVPEIQPYFEMPVAFFGHSMGALVGFEIARRLRKSGFEQPVHLFVSACRAPQIPPRLEPMSQLHEQKFLMRLQSLNGMPLEIFRNEELMQILMPVLRADFFVVDGYKYDHEMPVDYPISVFGGAADPNALPRELAAWHQQTRRGFSLQIFPGGHFFLRSAEREFLRALTNKLEFVINCLR